MRAAIEWTVVVAAAALVGGCGGSSASTGGSGGCTPTQPASVAIDASGFTPKILCVPAGGTVTFTNGDSASHDIESGMTCQGLNLGTIAAGQSKTVAFPGAATCPFFDAAHSSDAAFQGTVTVTPTPSTGGGGGSGGGGGGGY
ncbi:cupredoxin domain-containing protein [Anaeromyxobacter oryzae]|uniref:EfeO-type cupredoxin-like domain-containing protein n=1 Tax=Anaeromyxobacter oryzae TaxID=2918170 RepID=A0ABN6MW26_9BACT|nr:hypothetical protein [Anaeromyxobacter oryzae]BDG05126.1 hypothetical protein AMOR_41220 [Anaeromyxobacter oryzae]